MGIPEYTYPHVTAHDLWPGSPVLGPWFYATSFHSVHWEWYSTRNISSYSYVPLVLLIWYTYFFSWSLFHIISCGMKTANLNSNNTAYPIFLWVATLCYSFLYQSGNILPTNPNIFNRLFVFLYYISIINTLLQKVFSHIWKTMTSISFSILYTIYTK